MTRYSLPALALAGMLSWPLVGMAQSADSAQTQAEQAAALSAENGSPIQVNQTVKQKSGQGNRLEDSHDGGGALFIGVDDTTVPAQRVDVLTNAFTEAFVGYQVWGAAYDPQGDRVFFNNGSTLYVWPVGGTVNTLGTLVDAAGATQSFVGLAFHDGTLFATKNIANEAIWAVDTDTLVATVHIDYEDADLDCGGLAADPVSGQFYCTNDDSTPYGSGLMQINPDGSATLVTPYPDAQTDIDGLAIGNGRAYLVTDEPGQIYVWDFVAGEYVDPLDNPWETSEIFAGAAWLGSDAAGPAWATFEVTKQFSDGNEAEVEVTLVCNTGLPLQQNFTISEGNPVKFVVTEFANGEMDCEVTESGAPAGYTPAYDNGSVISEVNCAYEDVTFGAYTCAITNSADAAEFTVTKDWVIEGAVGDEVLEEAQIDIYCNNAIVGGYYTGYEYVYHADLYGDGDSVTVSVDTTQQAAECRAEESIYQSGVETDNGCGTRAIPAGGSSSCTITNTVFFEGIPTLSQYGMALMALLMLGLGFVGLRRFV